MPHTTLILSDTHLGRPRRATAQSLQPLWQGVDELVINGDVAEVQLPWLRSAAVREVDRLQDLTRRDGVRLTLLSGNHDAYLTDRRHLELAGGQVLIMHGDALDPAVTPWTRSAKAMRQLTERELAKVDPQERDTLPARLSISQHVGHAEFLEDHVLSRKNQSNFWRALTHPWEVPPVFMYWRREPALAERFMQTYAPKARVMILGHSHHAGVWQRGERTIINTGGFMFPARPWCVMIRDNELTVHRVHKHNIVYKRSEKFSKRLILDA